ncbi:MAG: hypothetical protein A2045_05725 [Rhodocyclales bacterium GWA2_65_20]|nr:MAG: hypothetical protein A2045_05725 [Rhodocyclales bacterium GWA2_65_20]
MKKLFLGIIALVVSLGISTGALAADKKAAAKAAPAAAADGPAAGMYWGKWPKGKAKGFVPPCGTNVLPLGGDDILQATVDTYCAVKPGKYTSYINPAVMKTYNAKGAKYPDGKTGVLEFKEIGVAFTTDHKGGVPVYDVVSLKDGKSVASKDKGHPLNPEVCAACHIGHKGVCSSIGFVCGNRS